MSDLASQPLSLAFPSKGRLKDQAEAWLGECGLKLEAVGGARGYRAAISGLPGIQVQLLSAGDIAAALDGGEVHLGLTGEDLLRERGEDLDQRVMLLRALGFGRADLIVAAPQSWIDVDSMADIDEVAGTYLARTGRRLRVATKYMSQTRAFFARHGIADYRIVESSGATEGAPAAGAAELVVDITTTGATLAANSLKIIGDGIILKSQAQLAASLTASWTKPQLVLLRRFLGIVEAKARARGLSTVIWPAQHDKAAQAACARFIAEGATGRVNGLLVSSQHVFDLAAALADSGIGPVSITRPDYVFEADCPAADALATRVLND
jgi:ATP phosphoribosyltransferase